MAFMLGCEKVCVDFPTKTVFESVSLGVDEGDRIGIVGRNGDGKSTLLSVMAGMLEPDEGRVLRNGAVRVGVLGQFDKLNDDNTVERAVVGDIPEYEWAGDARIRDIIAGLASDIPWDAKVGTLSGGQRRRVDLVRLLIGDWDILALDEPTNHLDVRAITWLANHLKNRWRAGQGALLVVTHDRWFLDEVCTRMWEVHDRVVDPFEGGFSAYILQRVERDRLAALAEEKRQNALRRELAWLARGPKARGTKPKFRVDAAHELIADVPPLRNELELKRMAMARLGKQVVELKNVTVRFDGKPAPVLDGVDWIIGPGDRYGIVGANGVGKTTLLKVIQGVQTPTSGFVKIGKTVKFAVLSQHLDNLTHFGDDRVRQVISNYTRRMMLDGKEMTPAQLLEKLGFSRADLNEPVCDLSGGQKRRLALMLILLDEPNVLILDEPGNDMDTDMLAAIEEAREEQDSVGGVIECAAVGLPAGIGSPMLDSVESRLASILFGVPAVKGVEFGAGFAFAALHGSHANDPFYEENGVVKTETNNNGGILGGITSGMPLIVRACIKPTPSIGMVQDTLNIRTGKIEPLSIHGRHDPCIVTRAAPVVEAACAVALADLLREAKGYHA